MPVKATPSHVVRLREIGSRDFVNGLLLRSHVIVPGTSWTPLPFALLQVSHLRRGLGLPNDENRWLGEH